MNTISLSAQEIELFNKIALTAMKVSCEEGDPESFRTQIDQLYTKVNGLPGRRRMEEGSLESENSQEGGEG